MASSAAVTRFRGLNNVSDPLRLGMEWLRTADNLHVTDTGALERREGYSRVLACAPAGRAYATEDHRRAYVADGLQLCAFDGSALLPLAQLTIRAPMSWAEINGQVFFANGVDSGIIYPDRSVLPWAWTPPGTPNLSAISGDLAAGHYRVHVAARMPDGRLTGTDEAVGIELGNGAGLLIDGLTPGVRVYVAPAHGAEFLFAGTATGASMTFTGPVDALGSELTTALLQPLPAGARCIAAWRSRLHVGVPIPGADASVVWASEPFAFHLFDQSKGFVSVPGEVRMLASHDAALLIGTDRAVHAYDGKALVKLADYGVTPGDHSAKGDDGRFIFLSTRGICAGMPFANLTEQQYSFAPGTRAGGAVVRRDGQVRYIVSTQKGGKPFNSHQQRHTPCFDSPPACATP